MTDSKKETVKRPPVTTTYPGGIPQTRSDDDESKETTEKR